MNHPYIIFTDLTTNIIHMLLPIGIDSGHIPLNDIIDMLSECTIMELFALYLSIVKSIALRKSAILESDHFNLLKCANMTNCIKKLNEIRKLNISKQEKTLMISEYEKYYVKKGIAFLQVYFDLLTNQEYSKAREFLRGDKGTLFGKQRLNTFFKNTKSIIGHLQIFIPLYELGTILHEQLKYI
jgi:hypothetical protein